MKIDLDARLTLGFVFGIVGLSVELGFSLFGAPLSPALIGAFGSIVLGTFGIGLFTQGSGNGRKKEEE